MSSIDEKAFIDELIFCLKEEDVVKAKALLQFASDSDTSVQVQKKALEELAKGPEKLVFPLLEYLTKIEISNPEVQESIYDLILDKSYSNTDLVIQYIRENEEKTKLLFIKAAGDLFLTQTLPVLEEVLLATGTDSDILAAAVQSLGNLRQPSSLTAIASLASHPDQQIKRSAIFAISQIGGQDAVDLLVGFLGADEESDKLAVEAIADIQDLYALEKLTALLASEITRVRDTAIDQLMKLGNKATPILTRASQNAEADYMVHLVTTLGYIGDQAAIAPILNIINTQPKDANIRQAAYEAMERIPSPKTAICLAQGLQDPEEAVRMSAARAIDGNLSKPLVAGLKNIIRQGNADAMNAVSALIDAGSDNVFNFIADEASFQELAKTHITEKAAPNTQATFLKKMIQLGKKDMASDVAKDLKAKKRPPQPRKVNIVIVDDSKMMLRLYKNKLSALGLPAHTFDRPEDAIPSIIKSQPDLVITDLNMPNISGLELTREVRRKFTRQDVPILMITTQSDFVDHKDGGVPIDDATLTKSGINQVLHKPFTDEAFNGAVKKFVSP